MRRALGDLGVAALTTVGIMGLLLAAGGIWQHVGGDDLHGFMLPRYVETARRLVHEQRLALWNPYEYGGAPLFAAGYGLTFYLPAPLLFATLSPYWALQGLYAFNVLVLACGCVTYLRAHGLPRWAGALAALIATAGVFNTPPLGGIDHPMYLAGVAWLPWILLLWERAVARGARPWLGFLALALAAQWFTGYPVFPMDSAVLLGVVALVSGGAPLHRRALVLGAGLALGAMLAAIQLLPLADAVRHSFRAVSVQSYGDIRSVWALGHTGMWRYQIIGVFGPGLPALALAALALARPTRTRLAWAAAALWAYFALDWPLDLLYRLPPFSGVRYPVGWIHLAPCLIGFLVAAGATLVVEQRRIVVRVLVAVLAVAATARAVDLVRQAPTRAGYQAPDYALLAERAAILRRVVAQLPDHPRFFGFLEMHGGTALRHHIASGVGYDPSLPPAGPRQLIDAVNGGVTIPGGTLMVHKNPRLARLLGVGLVSASPMTARLLQQQGFRVVGSLPGGEQLLHQDALPRVRVVDQTVLAPDDAVYARLLDPDRDLVATAVVRDADAAHVAAVAPAPAAGRAARIVEEAPERVVVEADTAAPALLVLADTYDPNWVVTLDGEAAPLLRVDYTFRGVPLPAGTHRVAFEYRPASVRHGALLSLFALGVALLLLRRPVRRP